ncbi:MAG: hypothetical protein EA427_06515 [Spirochaetaceae bacterium]|nr:MAG: hypothetical protein EA427_06515 [Spirochaetaceae bacterium]
MLVFWLPLRAEGQETLDRIRGSRIAVLPFVNATEVSEFDRIAESASDSIRLILHWSRQYDVREMPAFNPFEPDGRTSMARIARDQRIRTVLFGRIVEIPGGRIELESAVYGTEEGRILGGARKEAFGAFDLVEASDELVITTVSALLGYNVELGAIIFSPSRSDVPYRVYVDGIRVGDNVRALPQVLTGRRAVEIVLNTAQGEIPVYSRDHLVRPGEALAVAFDLPAVTQREQVEIMVRQGIALRLLGDPSDYGWAQAALGESRELLRRSDSAALEPLRAEQDVLEAAWRLDREFMHVQPELFARQSGRYEPGDPLPVLPETQRISRSPLSGDPRVAERVRRNGYAQYHLTWLRWGESLSHNEWDEASRILEDLAVLERQYGIGGQEHRVRVNREYGNALEEAESLARRRRRPWPYVTLGIGLGGIGFGTYMYATDEVDNHSGSDRDTARIVQWGSIAGGAVISIASIARIVRNNRAGETYLREWARETHGYLMDMASRVLGDPGFPGPGATALVLGPVGEMTTIGTGIHRLPALVTGVEGEPLSTGRAPLVSGEAARLLSPGLTILTVE